jgi:hypothetical protein
MVNLLEGSGRLDNTHYYHTDFLIQTLIPQKREDGRDTSQRF